MSLLGKKVVIYDCNNGAQGKVYLNGEELPQCIRCCPKKKWADIMLYDHKGRVLLNAARDSVIVVRVIGDHIEFKMDDAKAKYIQDITMPKDWPNKGN